ncbi:hypothetical protein [Bradyrhizobium guangzhouense]|uniref:Secretin/TonB short N-terminal domain-containing protein n=1 Tax=Bradyrhizobium guangzhouense TaxID=1325095 RepID=A0AAE5WZC7_9BRAD|nr:hypothetical protein [Bradyrhizobium guangzhouense]QAU45801.1 hypothetical protein XH91_10775 [Bradyrhizobium guangzhouense]RXH07430.1 hypothetical protein EAS56_32675 [Bradyrhizobium guangzhouense]
MTMRRLLLVAMLGSATVLALGRTASAEVKVAGRPDAVHLEVHDASLHDVLAALQERFNLRYRSADALEAQVTGVFDGPLRRVVARLLSGHDYAMQVTADSIDVLVLASQGPSATVVAAVTPASAARPPLTAAERKHYDSGHLR